ncbi:MAG: hypothetical protein ACREHD_31350 [Pirellulales bacterium]
MASKPDDLRKVVSAICTRTEFSTPDPWSVIEVTIDGAKRRERTTNTPQGVDDNVVGPGVTVLGMGPANQTSIVRTSANTWPVRGLDDFRYLPNFGKGFRVSRPEEGHVLLSSNSDPKVARIQLDVDEATGFVHWQRSYREGGIVGSEILQFGPVSHQGDLVLPSAIARVSYSNGALQLVNILVIEQADVNVDLPDDAFVSKAMKGTLIADYRDPQHKDVFYTKSDIDDVAEAFPLSPASTSPSVERSPTSLFLLGAGAAVLALLVFLYRHPRSRGKFHA